jgi:hypothetical protein
VRDLPGPYQAAAERFLVGVLFIFAPKFKLSWKAEPFGEKPTFQ